MKQSTWKHVFPSWVAGPRKAHPKFGGEVVIGGIPRVEDRLVQIHERFPDDLSSGHVFHEVRLDGQYERHNSANAISFEWLRQGIEAGRFPKWSAFTSPAFGLRGVENGAILSDNPAIVKMAIAGHETALKWAQKFKNLGIGRGHVIWWPAFDSRLHRGPLSKMGVDEAWNRLAEFWIYRLRDNEQVISLEYKPSVPGALDFIPTMDAAIAFCQRVNEALGRIAMVINLEWAHALIGGETVTEATRKQIAAGLLVGMCHGNSAELAMMSWPLGGTVREEGTPGDDADWAVGEGGQDRWDDQQEAVGEMDKLGIEITFEHDIDPAGEDPMECYARSRGNFEKMLANVRAKTA